MACRLRNGSLLRGLGEAARRPAANPRAAGMRGTQGPGFDVERWKRQVAPTPTRELQAWHSRDEGARRTGGRGMGCWDGLSGAASQYSGQEDGYAGNIRPRLL